jgi:hypothetical protein
MALHETMDQQDGQTVAITPSNNTGSYNTANGFNALHWCGDERRNCRNNTATGYGALYKNEGHSNTASGYAALNENNRGNHNTALGYGTLTKNLNTSRNTAVGAVALNNNT